MQDSLNHLLATPVGFAVFFIALWCSICYLISFMSGWLTLARRFRSESDPFGDTRNAGPYFYTVYLRYWTHYSSVIRLTAAEDALYLSVLLIFRIGHPPLRIPWKEITFSRTRRFWFRYVVLTLGEQERIPVRIPERMARKLGILERMGG